MNNVELASAIIEKVGGKANVSSVTHCMTRLRFVANDINKANQQELKEMKEVMGVVYKGGQLQLIIGPQVSVLYDEVVKLVPGNGEVAEDFEVSEDAQKEKLSFKGILNGIMGALSGCMVPIIPVLLCSGFAKTIVAIFGPQLLNVLSPETSLSVLFTFVGDAGFYFLPVIVGYTAAEKFKVTRVMGVLMGAIMIHPTMIQMAAAGTAFNVYGIPSLAQNYTSTVLPVIMIVWAMSYVERFFKKHTPDVLKVMGVPFGTLLVMLPLALCVFGPAGSILGQYISTGIINLYSLVGPLAVAILGATFALLVLTGMHTVLFVFLFTTFPMVGYDGFMLPAVLCCSWAGAGVLLACAIKFKDPQKKAMTFSYFLTWLLGGVGEPLLYGLMIPYKTPLYASVIAGGATGLIAGTLGLKAYVLNATNGIYGLAAFFGGPNSNYIILGITLVASIVIGFATMWFFKLDESDA